jgi:hypothetical protein
LKLLEAGKAESTIVVDPEERYVSTDHGNLGRGMEKGNKGGTEFDNSRCSEAALRGMRSMDREDCGAETCVEDILP